MVLSMTGFGKSSCEIENKKITVEIKSLNSKQLDLSSRVPNVYKEKEIDFRNRIAQKLERGKIDLTVYIETIGKETTSQLNIPMMDCYVQQIKKASETIGIQPPSDWFSVLLRLPDTIKTENSELDETEWNAVSKTFDEAIENIIKFRTKEGVSLKNVFSQKIANINSLLTKVDPFEAERVEKIKTKLLDNLNSLPEVEYDKNRFEQELIYYIEKLDVNEEKNRLKQHLKYFNETMDSEGSCGKKLGFIAQEIGREINTLGSKSNQHEMQKIVVMMKDELEQIKEQVLNVL